jgi:hypothetical protein
VVKILIIYLFFVYFFKTSVFIHFWQLKTAVFQHRCLIRSVHSGNSKRTQFLRNTKSGVTFKNNLLRRHGHKIERHSFENGVAKVTTTEMERYLRTINNTAEIQASLNSTLLKAALQCDTIGNET